MSGSGGACSNRLRPIQKVVKVFADSKGKTEKENDAQKNVYEGYKSKKKRTNAGKDTRAHK